MRPQKDPEIKQVLTQTAVAAERDLITGDNHAALVYIAGFPVVG